MKTGFSITAEGNKKTPINASAMLGIDRRFFAV
jgi:hypothetical protein